MKTKLKQITLLLFLFLSFQTLLAQEENRYELSLNTEYNGIKNKIKLTNISYSLSNYTTESDPSIVQKPDPFYISVSSFESMNKDFYKIFEIYKRKINGFIEIKDTYGKNPIRKIEFKNGSIMLTESISSYGGGNAVNSSISIYSDSFVIDGVGIFSKQ